MDWTKDTSWLLLIAILFCVSLSDVGTQESNYFFSDPSQPRYLQSSFQQNRNDYSVHDDIRPFHQSQPSFLPIDPYFQSDLQTSELPLHLQQTLPQYRLSGLSLTTSEPSGFRIEPETAFHDQTHHSAQFPNQYNFNQNRVIPSTHRPNYSHLFPRPFGTPSRTEKFLRDASSQDTQDYTNGDSSSGFRPSLEFSLNKNRPAATSFAKWPGHKDRGGSKLSDTVEKLSHNLSGPGRNGNNVVLGKNTRNAILNHRTRTFTPNEEKSYKSKPLVKDFYVNNNGDVLITTKNPFSPKPTSTTVPPIVTPRKNPFKPSFKLKTESPTTNLKPSRSPFVPKMALTGPADKLSYLKPFTNEPIATKEYQKDAQEVADVAKPVTVPPDQLFTISTVGYDKDDDIEDEDDDYYISSAENSTPVNYEYIDEDLEEDDETPSDVAKITTEPVQNKTIDVTESTTTEKQVIVQEISTETVDPSITTMEPENLTILPTITKKENATKEDEISEEEYEYYDYEDSDENSSKEEEGDQESSKETTSDVHPSRETSTTTSNSPPNITDPTDEDIETTTEEATTTLLETTSLKSENISINTTSLPEDKEEDLEILTTEDDAIIETTTFISTTTKATGTISNESNVVAPPITPEVEEIITEHPTSEMFTTMPAMTSPIVEEVDEIITKSPTFEKSNEQDGNFDDNRIKSYDSFEEYEDESGKEITDSNEIVGMDRKDLPVNKSFEVVTMKPAKSVKDDNFKEFMDSADMDSIDDGLLTTNSNEASEVDVHVASMDDNKGNKDKKIVSVVSVVTTKSVVNNTVIVDTVTPTPLITEQMTISNKDENTTDSWIIIASVQTSRSVSGARYLPSGIVEQEEKTTLISDINREKKLNEPVEERPEDNQTTIAQSVKPKTSTESLIDKLDRVQSDLSNKYLIRDFNNNGNNYIISEGKEEEESVLEVATTTTSTTTAAPTTASTIRTTLIPVKIKKFPSVRPPTTPRPRKLPESLRNKIFQKVPPSTTEQPKESKNKVVAQDVSVFLPPGYKPEKEKPVDSSRLLEELLSKVKIQDPSALLPPGYKGAIIQDNVTSLLPPGYKLPINESTEQSDISSLLPSGYPSAVKAEPKPITTEASNKLSGLFKNASPIDINAFLPKNYKSTEPTSITKSSTTEKSNKLDGLFKNSGPVDISAFLPKDYKPSGENLAAKDASTPKSKAPMNHTRVANSPEGKPNKTKSITDLFEEAEPEDLSKFLPPGFKPRFSTPKPKTTLMTTASTTPETTLPQTSSTSSPPSSNNGFKIIFPSRPGQNKKTIRLTTPKPTHSQEGPSVTPPTILKSWPTRATTEFTGWPTPSTTPISIEKLLEAAKTASTTSVSVTTTVTTTTTSTTTTTTTTPKPTTPGVCQDECDLVGTIKLVGGAKWVPELLDRNTEEWQILANEVQSQLERVYSKSEKLNKWYKKIRIDGFSQGSILVDYVVELNDVAKEVTTTEMKKIFHDSLSEVFRTSNREPKFKDLGEKIQEKLTLGNLTIDPVYTDFVVLPHVSPTTGYAEDDVLLPQWAIAVIVIGLASLLFVIIFGVTVLVNRQKNNKKRAPIPLTDDMIHELNKNHMGGVDNYGAEDVYNMDDVWDDRAFETKPKKRSADSIHDNSMSNLYDSWRSEWKGYYGNNYYGNNIGHSHNGYGRRRPDYDTNF